MSDRQPWILVTGGAGYIGSHCVLALQQRGYGVIILDNLIHGHRELLEPLIQDSPSHLIVGDLSDRPLLERIFQEYPIRAVMHFAAYINVGESVANPLKYYRNNFAAPLTLLETMVAAGVSQLVFSSTAAVYGVPRTPIIPETHPFGPINPYGVSKWMVEQLLQELHQAHGLRSVIFRYFNAAGADPKGRLGEDHHPETHLIPLVLHTALGHREAISIFGTDYPTPDGTCVRDYIHVGDLAQAHVLGLEYLQAGGESNAFNLGNGQGFSVREVIETAKTVTQKPIKVIEGDRRPGDPPHLVGSSDKARRVLGWSPQYGNLQTIIRHAWQWHQKRHGGS